jgi:Haspin like kinase domain
MQRAVQTAHALSRAADPSRENRRKRCWERYVPRTNVRWLRCLLWTLLERVGEDQQEEEREMMMMKKKKKGEDGDDDGEEKLFALLRDVLEALGGDNRWWMREEMGDTGPGSAEEVVRLGREKGWLSEADLEAVRKWLGADE